MCAVACAGPLSVQLLISIWLSDLGFVIGVVLGSVVFLARLERAENAHIDRGVAIGHGMRCGIKIQTQKKKKRPWGASELASKG